jgi:riboflavin kinase/FMN adenylyltransferase
MEVLRSFEELGDWAECPLVFTVGYFDGVHRGHQELLTQMHQAARKRRAASLAITFSNSPRGFHHPERDYPHLSTPEEKLRLLDALKIDSALMLEYGADIASQTALEFISRIQLVCDAVAMCVGYDSKIGRDQVGGRYAFIELARRAELTLLYVEALTEGGRAVKSREIRQAVGQGRITEALKLLGRPYGVSGEVVHGKGEGQGRLKTPTANISVTGKKLVPPIGVYAGRCMVDGAYYPAAVCVMSTTLHANPQRGRVQQTAPEEASGYVVEAHLEGFAGDLYGRELEVEFLEFIREWFDFSTAKELRQQIAADIRQTVEVFERFH